jgi:hypothetical protein
MQIMNTAVFLAVLWVNGLAGVGAISGESIGVIANRYRSEFLPADYVFGIWSLIYLGLTAFAIYQALPAQRSNTVVQRLGLLWAANGVLNIAWIVTFSYSRFGSALVLMVALLLNLIWIHERIGFGRQDLAWRDRLLVAYPFGLYLAWISVALIANTFQLMTYLEWSGWGLSGPAWSAIMMTVATGLGAFMVFHRGNWIFPLVVAWALIGIANRFPSTPLIADTAYAMTGLGLVAMGAGLLWRRRARA